MSDPPYVDHRMGAGIRAAIGAVCSRSVNTAFESWTGIASLALVVLGTGCGAVWDQRPGAFNDALASGDLKVGKIPTDFGAKGREEGSKLGFELLEGTEAKGSADGIVSFHSYDEKTKRICFVRRNAHDLGVGEEKKYVAKERKPGTYAVDVWDSLQNLEPLPLPPRGFGTNPVEVTERDSGSGGGGTFTVSNTSAARVSSVSVWAYVDICAVLAAPLKAGSFVTLARAQMKQPGYEADPIPPEVFAWKVTDEAEPGLAPTPAEPPASPERVESGEEPPTEPPAGE
jgi:hypothetical protein